MDFAADATALMLADVSDYILKDKATACTRNLFYALGKWIYLTDALDDYDKDVKRTARNFWKSTVTTRTIYSTVCFTTYAKTRRASGFISTAI